MQAPLHQPVLVETARGGGDIALAESAQLDPIEARLADLVEDPVQVRMRSVTERRIELAAYLWTGHLFRVSYWRLKVPEKRGVQRGLAPLPGV
jgi:hypothetical protein